MPTPPITDDFLRPIWTTDRYTQRPYFLVRCTGTRCARLLKTRGDPSRRFTQPPLALCKPLCHRCRRAAS